MAWILVAVVLCIAIAVAVIVLSALHNHSAQGWQQRLGERVRMLLRGDVKTVSLSEQIQPRQVNFRTMWSEESQSGSAYVDMPSIPAVDELAGRVANRVPHREKTQRTVGNVEEWAVKDTAPSAVQPLHRPKIDWKLPQSQ